MKKIEITHKMLKEGTCLIDAELVVAAGMFDGVHKGHQVLIGKAIEVAENQQMKSAVLSISNKPNVARNQANCYLTTEDDKEHIFSQMRVDYYIVLEFTEDMKHLEPELFLSLLLKTLNIKCYVVGFDYCYGRNAKGNVASLKKYADVHKTFEVIVQQEVELYGGVISTSQIKTDLRDGSIEHANNLLGRPYTIKAKIIHGENKGHTLGFPTINMSGDMPYVIPKVGVYATQVCIDGKNYIGLTNIGYSPTVKEASPLLIETTIVDFTGDLYGRILSVSFYRRIRGEQKFSSLDALIDQMNEDKKNIVEYFEKDCQ